MNNSRRKEIAAISDKLDALQDLLNEIKEATELIKEEETKYYENMPESLKMSDRGMAAEAAVGNLDDAIYQLENLDVDSLRDSLATAGE